MTKAFSYLRVSGKGQVSGDGFPRQRAAIKAYAKANGFAIVREFADEGVSGAMETTDRPAFAEMVATLHSNGVRTVIVEKLDRLARDLMVQEAALSYFLNARETPTCVVAVNDILAIALLKAAIAKGVRVPTDLSITGFDDLYVAAHIEVPLTTMRQPFETIGSEAARLLFNRIKGKANPTAEIRVPAEIVIRDSVR